jgi:ectoine hydroxylase-related dioxygenase (phytanoyl-CoA dioxygenase family)
LEYWRRVTDEALEQRMESVRQAENGAQKNQFAGQTNQGDPDSYYAKAFVQCMLLVETHSRMRELLIDPRLGKLIGNLEGIGGVRFWFDQALVKQPYGNPTAWHLDNPFWPFYDRNAATIWVALDDATMGNGCLWYVPGTHRVAMPEKHSGISEKLGELFQIYPQWKEIAPVACPCPAGSAIVHNGLTAHGAGANMTNKPRRAMTCAFMPDGARYNGQRSPLLPAELLDRLRAGDPLADDARLPLVWKESR